MLETPSAEKFAESVAAELHRAPSIEGEITFDAQRFTLQIKDAAGKPTHEIFLGNYFQEYCAADSAGREIIIARAASISQGTPNLDGIDFRSRLMPQIKDRWSVEKMNMSLMSGQFGPREESSNMCLPYGVLAHHFAITVAYDMPEKIAYVNYQQLDEWGIDFQEALDIAARNLMQRTQWDMEFAQDPEGNPVFATSIWHDDYDAARVIFSDDLKQIEFPGNLVLLLLNANSLFLTGSESEQGLVYALTELVAAQSEPRALPPFALELTDSGFTMFVPPEDHALNPMFVDLQSEYVTQLYEWQQELLQGDCASLVDEHPIAKYESGEIDGHKETFCYVFAEHVPVFIPSAVLTVVLQKDGNVVPIPWDTFQDVMQEHLVSTSFYAPLEMLTAFPSEEQLARMQAT